MALTLILEISGNSAQDFAGERRKVFDSAGGRIGRASDCDWVLPNRYVSRHHATVSCIDGVFHIESISENGLAVNDAQNTLSRLERRALKSGDRLFIDEYEISVQIPEEAEAGGATTDTVEVLQASRAAGLAQETISGAVQDLMPSSTGRPNGLDPLMPEREESLEPLKRFLNRNTTATTVPAEDPAWNHSSSLADHFKPPPIPPATEVLPQGWEEEEEEEKESGIRRSPAELARVLAAQLSLSAQAADPAGPLRPPLASGATFDVDAFLRAAGLNPESVPAEMAPTLGHIVRCVVQGLVDVLHARAAFRDQFRLPVTRVQMSQNNPLKFAANAEDALAALLRTPTRGYLSPLEAFEDAFDDIRFHQLAMLAGMRAGFNSITQRFDPAKLREQADRRNQGLFSRLGAKGRYWNLHVNQFEEIAGNPDSVFQRLYGEEFSSAYERQLEELKRNRASSVR
jgi:type VI secretion system protein ImpI